MERTHIFDCYSYVLDRLKELSMPYEEQVKCMEDFACWNLPNEIAECWSNMDYFINLLYYNHAIDKETECIATEIRSNFMKHAYGEADYSPDIWTHKAMETNNFWVKQRDLAKQALARMKLI